MEVPKPQEAYITLPSHEWEQHVADDKAFQDMVTRILFGDLQTQETGMKQKVDEMHDILMAFKGLVKLAAWVVAIGAAIVAVKGWVLPK